MKRFTLAILLVSLSFVTSVGIAEKPDADPSVVPAACTDGCSSTSGCCTTCEPVCCPQRVKKKEKKYCWKVLPKYICIPAFKWPWGRCCAPKCGRVRCINVLEKHEYKCDQCGYEWDIKMVRVAGKRCSTCKNSCCPDCGANGGCTD